MNEYVTELLLKNAVCTVDEKLMELRNAYRESGVPTLLTESLNELVLMARIKNPANILELGTATGCSAIALLFACPDAALTTVEKFRKSADEAARNFKTFGVDDRITQYVGDAVDIISNLNEKFDFVFLDCNKSKYKDLLPIIKLKMTTGGVLFADNVLYRGYITGEVKAPHRHNTIKNNMREFLRLISTDKGFITTISDVGDGVSISYKK
jgi:predicted O-methyltransferase YrrM